MSLVPRRALDRVRVLEPQLVKQLLNELGPDDGKEGFQAESRSRNRLIAEWLLYCGLRIEEVLGRDLDLTTDRHPGLTVSQFHTLPTNPKKPFDHSPISVIGKYNKARIIAVPNWLVLATKEYIQGERTQSTCHLPRNHEFVFVNGIKAHRSHRGKKLSIRRYQAIFSQACIRAGLCRKNDDCKNSLATHSPHDLRHTYAVMTYFAQRSIGNVEPWKLIQSQLGHSNLRTTTDTYLQFVSAYSKWEFAYQTSSTRILAGLIDG
nr:tyrosine-type recombinase/integrase [Oleiagrimonas sp. C23AA]